MQAASESDAEVAYARVGTLCEAIKAELNNDLKIHDAGILPQFINLPQVTAGEYCRVWFICIACHCCQYQAEHTIKKKGNLV